MTEPSPGTYAVQKKTDDKETRRIDIVTVYELIRTLIIIVLICTFVVSAGMVAVVQYNANTRRDTKLTAHIACATAGLIHGRAPTEFTVPEEC